MTGPTEVELLRSQSPAYIERLVRECGPWMLGLARRILNDETEAEDAVQDAFISAFKGAPNFDGQSQVTTWLHRILVNSALMRLRMKKRRTVGDERLAAGDAILLRQPAARRTAPADLTMQAVRAAVESLPESYRLHVLLRDIEGMEMEEVATLMDLTVSGTKSRLHRGRAMLREKLLPILDQDGDYARVGSSMGVS